MDFALYLGYVPACTNAMYERTIREDEYVDSSSLIYALSPFGRLTLSMFWFWQSGCKNAHCRDGKLNFSCTADLADKNRMFLNFDVILMIYEQCPGVFKKVISVAVRRVRALCWTYISFFFSCNMHFSRVCVSVWGAVLLHYFMQVYVYEFPLFTENLQKVYIYSREAYNWKIVIQWKQKN